MKIIINKIKLSEYTYTLQYTKLIGNDRYENVYVCRYENWNNAIYQDLWNKLLKLHGCYEGMSK